MGIWVLGLCFYGNTANKRLQVWHVTEITMRFHITLRHHGTTSSFALKVSVARVRGVRIASFPRKP